MSDKRKSILSLELHLPSFGKVSIQEQINFARHLAITIKSGLPIFEALKIIRKQTSSRGLRKILDKVISDVSNGQFLAESLTSFKRQFGDFFINIVRVGETSGTLAPNLLYLAEELRKKKEIKRKVRSAMVYPIVILLATIGITSLLMFFVFPKVIPIFKSLKVELPLTTKILIGVVDFFTKYGWYVLGGIVLFFILMRLLLKIKAIKRLTEKLLLHLPVVSRLIVDVNMANFTRVLAVLLKSGIKIVEAIKITGETFDNLLYRETLIEASDEIKSGAQLAEFLERKRRLFPQLVVSMVQIGENTGNLEDNLNYLADYYTEEADIAMKNLTTLLEPLLLLLMGIIVLFISVSIIMPIYSITQSLRVK